MSSNTNTNTKNMTNPVYKLNDTKTPIKNQKTRLCNNISTCIYGQRCHYAHTFAELKIADCAFGKDCIFIHRENNCYSNNKKNAKLCFFRHPEEDDTNYNFRIGNSDIKTPSVKVVSSEPPRIRVDIPIKESPLDPIKLNFNEKQSDKWVTVRPKKRTASKAIDKDELVSIVVSESDVLGVMGDMIQNEIRSVHLTINY
jgi:hypothetical protein